MVLVEVQQLGYLVLTNERVGAQHPDRINCLLGRLYWRQQRLLDVFRVDARHER